MSFQSMPSAAPVSQAPRRRVHRYLWILWALGFAVAGPFALVLFWTFAADSSLGEIPLLFAWALAAVVALGIAIWSGIVGRWDRAIAAGMLPLSLALTLLTFDTVWFFAMAEGEYIHFRLMRASYLAEIARLPAEREPRTAVFLLSQDGWAGISNYDESDEVALPDAQRSPAWKVRIAGTWLEIGAGYVRPLDDHFYIVRISQ